MSVVDVSLRPARTHLLGHRTHHGLTGEVLTIVGGVLVLVGAALMAHDWADRGVWVLDFRSRG